VRQSGGSAARASPEEPVQAVGYSPSSLSVGGQQVPLAIWYPAAAQLGSRVETADAPYDYFISLGKLFQLFLGLGVPLVLGRRFTLRGGDGVRVDAPLCQSWGAGGQRPGIIFAHGYLGSRFDMLELCERLARRGFVVAAPDFAESLSGSFEPTGATARGAILKATMDRLRRDFGAARFGIVGHSAGAGTATTAADEFACGRVALAGLRGGYSGADPFLVIASAGDGVVPLRRVRQALPAGTEVKIALSDIDVSAQRSAWLVLDPLDAGTGMPPCHISFLSPATNGAMVEFLSPLLPLANFLGVPVLDFDVYRELRDAGATAKVVLPVIEGFFANHTR